MEPRLNNMKLDSSMYMKFLLIIPKMLLCLIYFMSHVIFKYEVTIKYYSYIINGVQFF